MSRIKSWLTEPVGATETEAPLPRWHLVIAVPIVVLIGVLTILALAVVVGVLLRTFLAVSFWQAMALGCLTLAVAVVTGLRLSAWSVWKAVSSGPGAKPVSATVAALVACSPLPVLSLLAYAYLIPRGLLPPGGAQFLAVRDSAPVILTLNALWPCARKLWAICRRACPRHWAAFSLMGVAAMSGVVFVSGWAAPDSLSASPRYVFMRLPTSALESGGHGLPTQWCGSASDARDGVEFVTATDRKPHIQVVYAHPVNVPDRFAHYANVLQQEASRVEKFVAEESNGTKTLRFDLGEPSCPLSLNLVDVTLPKTAAAYMHPNLLARSERWLQTVVTGASLGSATFARLRRDLVGLVPPSPGGPRDYIVFVDGVSGGAEDGEAGWTLTDRARVVPGDGVDAFIALLTSPERRRPVLVFTPDRASDFPLNVSELAVEMNGGAHVVVLSNPATFELSRRLGKFYSVYGGAARIYKPGFHEQCYALDHKLILPERFEDLTPDERVDLVLGLAGLRRRPASAVGLAYNEPHGAGAAEPVASTSDAEDREVAGTDQEHALEALERHIADLEAELQSEQRRSAALAHALASRGAGDVESGADGRRETGSAVNDSAPEPPRTVLEALQRAAAEAVYLRFAPDAYASAADSPFRRPEDVYEKLLSLDELAAEWDDGELGKSLADRARELGLNWRSDVSVTARNKAPRDYTVQYDGHSLDLGPHVVVGNGSGAGLCARIYVAAVDGSNGLGERCIVVGHVGRHLKDSTT